VRIKASKAGLICRTEQN